jgi:cytochrome c551
MGRLLLALALAVVLAAGVVACGGESADDAGTTPVATPTETPATPVETGTPAGPDAADGATLYSQNCAGCHGADGSGGAAPAVADEDDAEEIRRRIERGGEGMPGFSDQMQPGEIEALARYVATGL